MIKKSLRFLMASGCFAACTQAGANATGPTELVLQRSSGQEIQRIALDSWIYDEKSMTLFADSAFGGYRCKSAPMLSNSPHFLALDKGVYSLASVDITRGADNNVIYATPLASGDDFAACRPALTPESAAKGPNTDLSMDVISNGVREFTDVPVSQGFSLSLGVSPSVATRLNANMICFDGDNDAAGIVDLEDTNGVIQSFRGANATSLTFSTVAANSLAFDTSATLSCFDLESARTVLSGSAVCPDAGVTGNFFADGFESNVSADWNEQIAVGIRVIATPELMGDALDYEVSIKNCADKIYNNIAVRDFFDASVLTFDSGGWNECSNKVCGAGDFATLQNEGYVRLSNDTVAEGGMVRTALAPGQTRSYAVRRLLSQPTPGSINLSAIAVIAPGSVSVPAYDAVKIDALDNAQPVLVQNGSGPLDTINEEGTLLAADILNASDTDSGFDCNDNSCISIATSNNLLLRPGDVNASFNAVSGDVTLDIRPRANRSGTVTISVSIEDAGGAVSEPVDLELTVDEVNDPPLFALGSGWTPSTRADLDAPGSAGVFEVDTALTTVCTMQQLGDDSFVLSDPDCPSQDWESADEIPATQRTMQYASFVTGVAAGPNETGTVTLECYVRTDTADEPCSSTSAPIFNFLLMKQVNSVWDLGYQLSGAKGNATIVLVASDGDLETEAAFRVSVLNSSPVFTTRGGNYELDENTVSAIPSAATDDDMDPITYSLGGADAALFQLVNGASMGDFEPIQSFDFEAPQDSNTNNVYEVTVIADDGFDTSSQDFLVTVADVNEAPVVVADPDVFDVSTSVANGAIIVDAAALAGSFDPDGDKLVGWQITSGNDAVDANFLKPFDIDQLSGEISVRDNRNFASETTFIITLVVQDAVTGGLTSLPATVTINVATPQPG